MHKLLFFIILTGCLLSSCKSSFEKIRTGGDMPLMLKTANKLYADKEYLKASTLYDLMFSNYRGQKEAEEIFFNNAFCNFYLQNYETANYMFTSYGNTFFNSSKKEEADYMAAYSIYKTSPDYKLDQTSTHKAIDLLQAFVNHYPESKRLNDCNKLIDELRLKLEVKMFENGKLYYNLQHFQGAITTFENLLIEFPDTKNDREIRALMVNAAYEWAINSIFEKQKERYLRTAELADSYLKKYPTGKNSDIKEIKKKAISKSKNPIYDGYQNTSTKS
ncbi:MAG: outer membrane protein assembly factor BamD [Saprospiraceae bacterium]|nr:outer membrane protein assembly factor BamD [Saprospiraceae bacterium]